MKLNFILSLNIILTTFLSLSAQSFQDDFSDGNFSVNPQWYGDVSKYTISVTNELQINDLGNSGSSALYVPLNIQDSVSWEFLIKTNLSTAGPSTSNRIRIYLQSDNNDFSASLNGYYLQIGESGSLDALEIYKVTNGSSALVMRGTDATVAGPIINSRVRIIRDNAGNWELFADHSGGTTFTSEATATDNTHNSGTFFGVYTTYSTTQGDRFSYDDFLISPLYVDVFPPDIVTASAISATEVDILFNEQLDPVTAEQNVNYSIDNGISVISAVLDAVNPALVHLTVSQLTSLTDYVLTVTDVEDLNGNPIISVTDSFRYVQISIPGFRDLIFNEIMIDPSPMVNLPETEFVEIYNTGNESYDLSGYSFIHRSASTGTESQRTLNSYVINPGEYVILHNSTDYQSASNDLLVPSMPALNNTSAYLILRNAGGDMVDSILYTNEWYQDANKDDGGWSLELINPNLICKGADNWIASNSTDGGTPGAVNSVLDNSVDTIPISAVEARQRSVNQAIIVFDDVLDKASAENISSYSVSGGLNVIFVRTLDDFTVELTFNANLQSNTTYIVNINGIADCVGNTTNLTIDFEYFELSDASHYDIIFNEIFSDVNPTVGLPELEFVELYNRSDKYISLEGYEFSDGTSTIAEFPFYILKPGQYLIIYEKGVSNYSGFGDILEFDVFPDLDAGSDDLVLSDAEGNIIDAVSYSSSWHSSTDKAEGGWTLERINPNSPCLGAENWTSSVAQPPLYSNVGGTPGVANSVLQSIADQNGPDLIRAYPFATAVDNNPDTIRLFFSEAVGDSSAMILSSYNIDNGISIIQAWLETPFYNTVVIVTDQPLQTGTVYTLTLGGAFTDCIGNPVSINNSVQFAKPEQIEAGDILINEVLFNPVSGGTDYLELYNNSDKVLNIGDLWVSNAVDSQLQNSDKVKTDYLLFPMQYMVLTENPEQVEEQYRTSIPESTPDLSNMAEHDLPTLPDDEGTIVIYALNGTDAIFIDSFSYSEDYHSPLLDDLNGVSLERIDFNAASNDKNNWYSAAQAVKFGTPTYRNSSAYSNEIRDDGIIQLPNNTFSPDGDGIEDFLLINYNIDDIGYLGNIAVYDAHGRFVKQIINNELLMQEGTLIWDGSNEAGEKALIGPYIILAEIFNPAGKVKRYKKTCILAGKFNR